MQLATGLALPPGTSLAKAPASAADDAFKARARKTAQDFESFFVSSMLDSMSAGIKTNKMFGGGEGESMFRSLLNQEYGRAIAARGSLGLGDTIAAEMQRLQQKADQR